MIINILRTPTIPIYFDIVPAHPAIYSKLGRFLYLPNLTYIYKIYEVIVDYSFHTTFQNQSAFSSGTSFLQSLNQCLFRLRHIAISPLLLKVKLFDQVKRHCSQAILAPKSMAFLLYTNLC